MRDENEIRLTGRLGETPTLSHGEAGNAFLRLRLATGYWRKASDGKEGEEITTWHTLKAWGATAEDLAQVAKKGVRLSIKGALRSETYTDRENIEREVAYVAVQSFEECVPRRAKRSPSESREDAARALDEEGAF